MDYTITPFRQELRRYQQQHPLFQSTHPFWQQCFRGRLSLEQVQAWALDVYPIVRDFARLYVQVAAKCDSEQTLTFLAETIFEETGSGVEAESHPTLFRNFITAVGIQETDIPVKGVTAAGREVWDYCWRIAREGSLMEGLTLVGVGIERPLPDFFQMIARAFRRNPGVDETAVKFFAVHTVADVKHSQLASRIVASLAGEDPAKQSRVREILFHLWDLQKRQLDELLASTAAQAAA